MEERQRGDYRLIERLGEGAAAEVFLVAPVKDKPFASTGQPVAVKVYKPALLKDKDQLKRIRREFKAGSTLNHPSLVRVFEANLEAQQPFLVMEFIDGMPLTSWIQQFSPIPGPLLLTLADQLVDGLEQLHNNDIIHRDLKPANVMMSSAFESKIMDFGVVHITAETPITDKDRFVGTIRNAAPELLFGGTSDARADLYSFGTILYALLYGEEVFADERQFARLTRLIEKDHPRFDAATVSRDQICDGLLDLTKNLLQKDPANRPQSIHEVRERLRPLKELFKREPLVPFHGYVATALTDLNDEERQHIRFVSSKIAEVAKQHGFYVYQPRRASDPVLHREFDAETVYALDRKKVVSADLLIVLLNKPSFGVGQELEIASGYGKPTLLIRDEWLSGKPISRMVKGCPTSIVGEIGYETPEDLERKLHIALPGIREKVGLWREGAGRLKGRIALGPHLKQLRVDAGYQSPDALGDALGISGRLVSAIESGAHENAGIQTIERICAALGVSASTLFEASAATSGPTTDSNIHRLEHLAVQGRWLAEDFISLRDDYMHEKAARGSSELRPDDEWLNRYQALQRRRLGPSRGPTEPPSLFA